MFNSFNNLSRRERIMLIVLGIVLIIAIYYYFFYQPIINKRIILEGEKLNKENQVNQYLITLGRMPELRARYAELEGIRNQLSTWVTSVDGILQVLENESTSSGIKITSFVPQENEGFTQINMLAEGSYEDLVLFLEGINKLRGQVEFKKLIINRKNQGDDSLNINGTFILHYDLFPGGDKL